MIKLLIDIALDTRQTVTDINEFILSKLDKLDEKLDDIKLDQSETRQALESHEKRDEEIHQDVKKMSVELVNQSKMLNDYNQSLREHMRRTDLLEEIVKPIHQDWAERQVVEKHKMKTWKKVVAAIGIATTIVGLIAGVIQLIDLL
jgi:predicted nuclease with TOPRIM domain